MDDFKYNKTVLVAEVDCTAAEGKPLCDSIGVIGYPTLKYGDPNNLEDYQGGWKYKSLKKFAYENLKPICSLENLEPCNDEQKEKIATLTKMGIEDLSEMIRSLEAQIEEEIKKLSQGLGLMKNVLASLNRNEL